jgi:hypothetical protein
MALWASCTRRTNTTSVPELRPRYFGRTVVNYQPFSASPLSVSIYDRPCQVLVSDGSGNPAAETDYFYDGATTLCVTISSAIATGGSSGYSGHDGTNYGPPFTVPRGNASQRSTAIVIPYAGSRKPTIPNFATLLAMDGLGRPVRSQVTSDPNCGSAGAHTVTTYDSLGWVHSRSNPYCTTSDVESRCGAVV